MIVFKTIHLYEWSVVPSDIERFRLMSCGMVLEQKIRTKGDIVLLHLVRYPLQHIAIKHYKARSIVTERKLLSISNSFRMHAFDCAKPDYTYKKLFSTLDEPLIWSFSEKTRKQIILRNCMTPRRNVCFPSIG